MYIRVYIVHMLCVYTYNTHTYKRAHTHVTRCIQNLAVTFKEVCEFCSMVYLDLCMFRSEIQILPCPWRHST